VNTSKNKTLIMIGGAPGCGKTTTAEQLKNSLERSVWLDGDWCWMMNPWEFSEQNKRMVERNISFMLNSFLENDSFEYVILSWVLHSQNLIDTVLDSLNLEDVDIHTYSLVCDETVLEDRMINGGREKGQIESSIERMKLYKHLNTHNLDISKLTPEEVVMRIVEVIRK